MNQRSLKRLPMDEVEFEAEKLRHMNRMKELKYIRETEHKRFQWQVKLIIEKGKAIKADRMMHKG